MEDIIGILEKSIQISKADLCILRWMKREQLQATLVDGNPGASSQVILQGVGCRSLMKGSWGFASTTDVLDIPDIISASERFAQFNPGTATVLRVPPHTQTYTDEKVETIDSMDEFFEISKEATSVVMNYPDIASCRIGIMVVIDQRAIVTTEGVCAQTVEPRILGNIVVIAREGNTICQYNEVVGGEYTLDSLALSEAAEKAARTALLRLRGKQFSSGRGNVLLGGEVVGLLIHEAVGHAAEADIARSGSFLSGKMNEHVASPSVSVVDDGALRNCFGTINVDDEGIKSRKTLIIENGVLKSFLHSRETSYGVGEPTGNARAWLYSREPQVRMTNTFLAPGDETFEELLEEVREGFYIQGSEGGNASPDGTFMVIATLAQKIERGELQDEFYKGPVMSGDASTVLQKVKGIGNEDTFVMIPSICGKGGSAFVGQGGPAVIAEVTMGGV